MRLALALLPLLAGCDILFQLREVNPEGDALVITEASVDVPPRCPYADNFDDNTIASTWTLFDPSQVQAVVSEREKMLDIALRNDIDDAYNGISTVDPLDLASKIARVTVYPMYEGGWYEAVFEIRMDDFNSVFVQTGAGSLTYAVVTDGIRTMSSPLTYDPDRHRHWQIRNDSVAHLVYFEVSGDSVNFDTLASVVVSWSFSSVHVRLFAGTFQPGGPNPGSARFDDFSVCPP